MHFSKDFEGNHCFRDQFSIAIWASICSFGKRNILIIQRLLKIQPNFVLIGSIPSLSRLCTAK